MSARQLLQEARALSVQERIELAADIWDSVSDSAELPVSEGQRTELRRRVQYYQDHADEKGATLTQIKANLGL
jgi:putative addiction module component (TIGR02574 family)